MLFIYRLDFRIFKDLSNKTKLSYFKTWSFLLGYNHWWVDHLPVKAMHASVYEQHNCTWWMLKMVNTKLGGWGSGNAYGVSEGNEYDQNAL